MDILAIILSLTILIYSSILHEIAHGYVAYRLGDPTAKLLGRLTLNPIKHIDPFMSIILPLILYLTSPIIFGGAKPVPVDPLNLREGRKDIALVALSGPLTNILLSLLGSILIHIFYPNMTLGMVTNSGILGFCLSSLVTINLLLALFNLIPIPPLDGSKVLASILPRKEAAAYLSLESIGLIILFALLFIPIGPFSLIGTVGNMINFATSLLGL